MTQSSQDCGCGTPCQVEPCPEDPVTPPVTQTCTPYEYRCGDWLVKSDANGCITRTRVATNVPDGVYYNATITITDGCISGISSGSRVLQSRPEPCTSGTPGPVVTPDVGLDPSVCNLMSGPANALLARAYVSAGTNMSVTGCGSQVNPFVVSYAGPLPGAGYTPTFRYGVAVQTPLVTPVIEVASTTLSTAYTAGVATVNTAGATFDKAGIEVTSGLVKSFVLPVMSITPSGGITASVDTATGIASLGFDVASASLPARPLVGASCGGAFIDPAIGVTPAGGTFDMAMLRIYGARVYTGLSYPITVFSTSGIPIGSGTGVINLANAAAAQALVDGAYTFAGTGAC